MNPKFLGISLVRRKAIPTKIPATPRRMVKRSFEPVKSSALLKTFKLNNNKTRESEMKKRLGCKLVPASSVERADEKILTFPAFS